ncbi:hypothetical protein [Actinomadura decatromicini]|uniref:Uncharacterized protein n=1 Tax=Actinomadura decatromicini TaxID=2604572 RepID=A0A5D3F8N6_9ACTN|nr:hypothetical protein [Actinomadura decatromicini]TYK44573.1 hypothetical protein FXF68_34510 [Actinomadura decatromicini]
MLRLDLPQPGFAPAHEFIDQAPVVGLEPIELALELDGAFSLLGGFVLLLPRLLPHANRHESGDNVGDEKSDNERRHGRFM